MTLVAKRPVLFKAKLYSAGDELPVNDPEMVDAWIQAESAEWKDEDEDAPEKTPKPKAKPMTAEPGIEGRTDKGTELQGKVPKTPARQTGKKQGAKK